jgi:hypothetical protein
MAPENGLASTIALRGNDGSADASPSQLCCQNPIKNCVNLHLKVSRIETKMKCFSVMLTQIL